MRFVLALLTLSCVIGCGASGVYGPEPTGAWGPANLPRAAAMPVRAAKAPAAQVVPAIDISQR